MKKNEKISSGVGATVGAAAGIGGVGAIFSGLSGAAITTTLCSIGGSMVGGIVACAAIPVAGALAVGGAAYGITKAINKKNGK